MGDSKDSTELIQIEDLTPPKEWDPAEQQQMTREASKQLPGGKVPDNHVLVAIPQDAPEPPLAWKKQRTMTAKSGKKYDVYMAEVAQEGEKPTPPVETIDIPEDEGMKIEVPGPKKAKNGKPGGQGPGGPGQETIKPKGKPTPGKEALDDVDRFSKGKPSDTCVECVVAAFAWGFIKGIVIARIIGYVLAIFFAPEEALAIGIGLLVLGVVNLIENWDRMTPEERADGLGQLAGGLAGGGEEAGPGEGEGVGGKGKGEGTGGKNTGEGQSTEGGGEGESEPAGADTGKDSESSEGGEGEKNAGPSDEAKEKYKARKAAKAKEAKEKALQDGMKKADAKGKLDKLDPADREALEKDPELKKLSYDPAKKAYDPDEARTALQAQEEGTLPKGPNDEGVTRSITEQGQTGSGDVVDGTGREWDIIRGGEDPKVSADEIFGKASPQGDQPGEDVLVNARDLTPEQRQALMDEVNSRMADAPPGTGEVRFVPKDPNTPTE